MATNTNKGHRVGAVKSRTQFENPSTGLYTKRNEKNGEIMGAKKDGKPYKGIAKEPDGRDTKNS